ncbi:MAG TPA: hybrid sensor histidine kinase/response regulator [Methylomirabilota bacterium]|nr:hybrid sensor histidine kinase/response regulator [Methylomirabilota bacterium]
MKKVLVIDDAPEIRMVIGETLTLFGFDALLAEDGETGVRLAREQLPDLIICDINMPNMDGYSALMSVRSEARTATIPFIFLSGAVDKSDIRRGMESGADDYLTKPFTPKELVAAVNSRLAKTAELKRHTEREIEELRGNLSLALPHELRTPLNGILGLASLLVDDYETIPRTEILESARFIQHSAQRLHRLIENFLAYSQIELMSRQPSPLALPSGLPPIAAHQIIPTVARAVADRFRRQADLTLDVGSDVVRLPEDNLKKIVEELVDNAFKFSAHGQPVLVATATTEAGSFQFSVTDRGRGMTPDQIRRIGPHVQFERKTFEQ